MTATLTEVLPASKSSPNSAIRFTPSDRPGCGLLSIDTARATVEYLVAEFPADLRGRAFHLAKVAGTPGTDAETDAYAVACGPAGEPVSCECKGFAYGRGKPCKHLVAVRALIENRWV